MGLNRRATTISACVNAARDAMDVSQDHLLFEECAGSMRHAKLVSAWVGLVCLTCTAGQAQGITCRIEQQVVQQFSDTVFPMVMTGKKRLSVDVLGASVTQDVPWKATISDPIITITKDTQTFSADVNVEAVATTWQGKVNGQLAIDYDAKRNAVVVQVIDAIVPVKVGPISMEIDVSKEVPDLPFQVMVPDLTIPFRGKKIRVQTTPDIKCEDGAVVVTSDVAFTKK